MYYLNDKIIGLFYIILTALLWSFIGILSKICLLAGLNPLQCAFFRSFFGFIAFFIHCLVCNQLRIPLIDIVKLMLFGAWGIGVYYSCAQYTILHAGAAMDIILQYTAPFWVAIFAQTLFNERLTKQQITSILIACLGTILVCISGGSLTSSAPISAIIAGLVTGLCYASHYPVTRFWQKKYQSQIIFTWMLSGGSIALLGVNCSAGLFNIQLTLTTFLSLAAIGILCTYLAFIFYGKALQKIGLVQAVITSELEPVLSMLWVWLFFGESFAPIGWFGSLLIIIAVLLLALWKQKSIVKK